MTYTTPYYECAHKDQGYTDEKDNSCNDPHFVKHLFKFQFSKRETRYNRVAKRYVPYLIVFGTTTECLGFVRLTFVGLMTYSKNEGSSKKRYYCPQRIHN